MSISHLIFFEGRNFIDNNEKTFSTSKQNNKQEKRPARLFLCWKSLM